MRRNDFFKYLLLGGGGSASRSELESETLPYTFVSKSQRLKDYRIYGNTVDGESVGDLVETGEHTGEYLVPITITDGTLTQTTDIYLPIQLKKLGDEFEYIDFKKQKQYRVRKNLWNGQYTNITDVNDGGVKYKALQVGDGIFTLSTNMPNANGVCNLFLISGSVDTGANSTSNGVSIEQARTVEASYSGIITIAYRHYNDIDPRDYHVQLEKGSTATDYEPYIENTEIDVVIPALPIAEGTNTLSIGTAVQPSKIWIQGNISEIETVSVQALQANMQSLQPLSFDDEDLEIDVMPTDNDLQLDVKPIEKPVLNLNNVSEIENAEIERGVESAE